MEAQNKQERAQGPVQFVEGIWGKISNDSRVRDALNKTRNFISNGPFIAIVVGTGGESKPVAFAVVPVLGLFGAGRVVQAIEEATSGKPVSINTVLTALQSLSVISIPGIVAGTVVSGAVNAVKLLVKREGNQAPRISTPDARTSTSTCSTSEAAQRESQIDLQRDMREMKQVEEGSEASSCEIPSKDVNSIHYSDELSRNEVVGRRESGQDLVSQEGAEPCGYRYKFIDDHSQHSLRSKL